MGTITITNLGKAYKQYPTRWSRLVEWLVPFSKPQHQLKWVLQDINFTVNPGEAVGIIGINGAGKSTLLKMIVGTTLPSTGSVNITGRVAALLELGMGFHPDFTGRQNTYMAGQLLGMSVEEITSLMPEIEAFAEIGDYMDQPVRVYSSGMQMRVAFSVATARRPDVLIVDEALSVGDAYFQHKSFDRIREFRKRGTTLLIVSHDKQAIQTICDRAILLNAGKVDMEGSPDLVMDYYNAQMIKKNDSAIQLIRSDDETRRVVSGNGQAKIVSVVFFDLDGQQSETLRVGEDVTCNIRVVLNQNISRLVLGYQFKDRLGQVIFGTNTKYTKQELQGCRAGEIYEFIVHFNTAIGPGTYSLAAALVDTDGSALFENYEWNETAAIFTVVNVSKDHFIGCSWIPPIIEIRKI